MNVEGIGSAAGVSPATWSGASRMGGAGYEGRMMSAVGATASALKMQPSELIGQLGSGQSLAAIASSRGVSRDSLLTAVSKAVSTSVPQGSQPLTGTLLQAVSSRIIAATNVLAG